METQPPASVPASNVVKNDIPDYTDDEKAIIKEIQRKFSDAHDFRFDRVGSKFEKGNTYMVEYATRELDKDFSWCYAYVDDTACELFGDGDGVITYMQMLLDKKRTFVQRLGDFDILDLVGAVIAFMIIVVFVRILWISKAGEDAVSKELLAIVSLILGYYFGRNKTS